MIDWLALIGATICVGALVFFLWLAIEGEPAVRWRKVKDSESTVRYCPSCGKRLRVKDRETDVSYDTLTGAPTKTIEHYLVCLTCYTYKGDVIGITEIVDGKRKRQKTKRDGEPLADALTAATEASERAMTLNEHLMALDYGERKYREQLALVRTERGEM